MKILAVGAHPDDIEIFMYGFLSICRDRGDEIFLSIATDGSAGGKQKGSELSKKRKNETIKALSEFSKPKFLNSKDGKLSYDTCFINKIRELIYSVNPDLIITHSVNDYHPDHRSLSQYIQNIASFEYPLIFAETMMGVNFEPDIYVDITQYAKKKEKAIRCHKTQNPERLIEIFKSMNQFRAMQCNLKNGSYAETYKLNKNYPFIDISLLIPKNISPLPFKLT